MLTHEIHECLLHLDRVSVDVCGTPVLRDVTARIANITRPGLAQGQVVGVLGPSGVGKTTLVRVLAGLLAPTSGSVRITGSQCPVKPGLVGVVHQAYPLFDHRTVLGNVLVRSRDATKARGLLERFGLGGREEAWPAELSGGERQRVAIVQQLMSGHTYLVLDEPFSGLDPLNKRRVCDLICEVSQLDERNTIIVVTHDIRDAIKISDTLWLLGREPGRAGARIVETYNLIERDLAWTPGIEHTAPFAVLARELEDRFATL